MPRIQVYLDQTTCDLLAAYAEKNACSRSHAAGKILSAYLMGETLESQAQLDNKQQFLRLLNVLNQVFLCVYDADKVSIDSSSAKECLEKIKQSVLNATDNK